MFGNMHFGKHLHMKGDKGVRRKKHRKAAKTVKYVGMHSKHQKHYHCIKDTAYIIYREKLSNWGEISYS